DVEGWRCPGRPPMRGAGQRPMEAEGAASIGEVLAPEASEPEGVLVTHHRIWSIGESAPRPAPAMAELAILAGRPREARIEASPRAEKLGGHRQIVGRKEDPSAVGGGPSGEVVDEEMGGRRVWITRQRVQRAAADGVIGPFGDLRGHGAEPTRLRPAVVVGESDELTVGSRRARV